MPIVPAGVAMRNQLWEQKQLLQQAVQAREAMQEGQAVQGGEGRALCATLKMQKDLASESNILTERRLKPRQTGT